MPKSKWSRYLFVLLLTLVPILLDSCNSSNHQSWLEPFGPVARKQLGLFHYSSWLGSLVLFAVVTAILISVFLSVVKSDALPKQSHGNLSVEIGLILISVLLVVLVAIPTIKTINALRIDKIPADDALTINVTGHQWWWEFYYPDSDFTTSNEIHIPQGKKVILNLASADVLHSFWVPKLAGKKDLIPNQNNQLWFETDANTPLGVYYGQCAEYCLGAHAYMKLRVIVDSPEDYAKWLANFDNSKEFYASSAVSEGKLLFKQKGCGACHAIQGFTTGSPDKPNLTNYGLRTWVASGLAENNTENLAKWIANPQAMKPGNYMPTLWQADSPDRDKETLALAKFLLSQGRQAQTEAALGGKYGN